MKLILILVAILSGTNLFAQNFSYPKLPYAGKNIEAFLPPNWKFKDSAEGDLNRDKINDVALVIEYKDTVDEMRPNGYENHGSPRVLLVLLKNQKTDSYDLFLQNNTFIVRYGEGGMSPDPYDQVDIVKGILLISIEFVRGSTNYKFRMQNGDLYLIGGSSYGSSGGMLEGIDANFSTGKAKIESGPIEEDPKVKWVTLPKTPLKKLRDMKMIFEWEVVEGRYL